MEIIERKKLAKAALLTTSLTLGMTLGQSLFNEAQASDSAGKKKAWVYITKPDGSSSKECGTLRGSDC